MQLATWNIFSQIRRQDKSWARFHEDGQPKRNRNVGAIFSPDPLGELKPIFFVSGEPVFRKRIRLSFDQIQANPIKFIAWGHNLKKETNLRPSSSFAFQNCSLIWIGLRHDVNSISVGCTFIKIEATKFVAVAFYAELNTNSFCSEAFLS